MNKKLFGTLLLGSLLLGGTFVSCKDYDDDIENLQSQVDALKSSAALKTDVDGLKSSLEGAISAAQNAATAAKSAADAADKKASEATSELAKKAAQADLEAAQAKLAAAEDKLAKLEAAIAELNGLEAKLTEATAAEFDKMKKELNGEFADIKASVEAMLESFNIHSLSLAVKKNNIINNGEDLLHWGVATKDIEWAGPKGNISKGDLLIGFIEKTKGLTVVPATVDLEGANIELVNSAGETAPVSITATPASKSSAGVITGSTRAADVQGLWNLAVEPSGVDATTIANAYASEDGKKNVAYAISVDGRVLTGYAYEVNVEKAACTHTCTAAEALKSLKLVETEKMNAGTANVYQVTNGLVYDSYLTFDENDAERAEDLGITVEGMTVVIPEGLTSRFDLYATLHVIDLKGNISKSRGKLVQVDYDEDDIVVKVVPIKPSLLKEVHIPIGTVLKNLSDTDAKQVKGIALSTKKAFVYGEGKDGNVVPTGAIGYRNSYDEVVSGDGTSAFDVRTVRTLTINPKEVTFNTAAVAGADTLKVDLMGNANDIIKTIYVPINVVKPSAADLAAELKVAGSWNGDVLNLKFDQIHILDTDVFNYNKAITATRLANATGEYKAATFQFESDGTKLSVGETDIITDNGMYAKIGNGNDALEWKIKTGSITIKLANVAYWTFTYDFTINMVDVYAGYQIKWVKADANGRPTATTTGVLNKDKANMPMYVGTSNEVTSAGLAWVYTDDNGHTVYKPLNSLTLPWTKSVELYDPYNYITIGGGSRDGKNWLSLDTQSYQFGDKPADASISEDYIITSETSATVKFPYRYDWGYERTYTLTVEIK